MNIVNLSGRLVKDAELQSYGKGKDGGHYLRNAIAVNDGIDKDGNKRVQFIPFTAWNATASIISDYVKKGDFFNLTGRIVQNNYEDEDGTKHYNIEVTASSVELLPNAEREDNKTSNGKYRRG